MIFNQQGRPEAVELLAGLFSALRAGGHIEFDHVIFCTNITSAKSGYKKGKSTISKHLLPTSNLEQILLILDTILRQLQTSQYKMHSLPNGLSSTQRLRWLSCRVSKNPLIMFEHWMIKRMCLLSSRVVCTLLEVLSACWKTQKYSRCAKYLRDEEMS